MNQKDAPEWNNQMGRKATLKGRAFVDTSEKPKRKAKPSWTSWKSQPLEAETKGRAFVDALEGPAFRGRTYRQSLRGRLGRDIP